MPVAYIKAAKKIKDPKTKLPRCCYHKVVNGHADKSKVYIQKRTNGKCRYLAQSGGGNYNTGTNTLPNSIMSFVKPTSSRSNTRSTRSSNISLKRRAWENTIDEGNEESENTENKMREANDMRLRKDRLAKQSISKAASLLGYNNVERSNKNSINKLKKIAGQSFMGNNVKLSKITGENSFTRRMYA